MKDLDLWLKLFEIIIEWLYLWMMSTLRVGAFIAVAFLIFIDLFARFFDKNKWCKKFSKKNLTIRQYIGIAILIIFILWPFIQEANFGNFGIKKIENKITSLERTIDNIFERKVKEHWFFEKFEKLNVEFDPEKNKYYHYEIPLKYEPVENTVELWLGQTLQNPMYYTVDNKNRKLIYRHDRNFEGIKQQLYGQEPAIVVQYIRK